MVAICVAIPLVSLLAQTVTTFRVHNPLGAAISTIHYVQSSHLDVGCKTFGCSAKLAPTEPGAFVFLLMLHVTSLWLCAHSARTSHVSSSYKSPSVVEPVALTARDQTLKHTLALAYTHAYFLFFNYTQTIVSPAAE